MNPTFSEDKIRELFAKLADGGQIRSGEPPARNPVHVVYGGADLFNAGTISKLGNLALKTIDIYAPNFVEFARAMWLKGAETLPIYPELIEEQEFQLADDQERVRSENFPVWFAWTIYQKTIAKLKTEPVEDFRIDFEDGYGIRADNEEDFHAINASSELAKGFAEGTLPDFIGFRIKSLAPETRKRAVKTLDLFLSNLIGKTAGELPPNFVVTLPKITQRQEVEVLSELLSDFEKTNKLAENSVKLEIMVETPQAIVNDEGKIALRSLVEAANGRCVAAHFGAYDYTASFGIAGNHQHLSHDACNFARHLMQISLAPLGVRLSDSVTTEMPIAIHRGEDLLDSQIEENRRAVRNGWRKHFNNVTRSMINGFYQSWDLHPAQLVARYAAVYAFFIEAEAIQAKRLLGFVEKATQALTTGNQFDDAASALGLLNFFKRAIDCGAMSEQDVYKNTGLKYKDLNIAYFAALAERKENGTFI